MIVRRLKTKLMFLRVNYIIVVCDSIMEKAMATHSSTLAWKILWAEEPSGLLSMGSHRVRHD